METLANWVPRGPTYTVYIESFLKHGVFIQTQVKNYRSYLFFRNARKAGQSLMILTTKSQMKMMISRGSKMMKNTRRPSKGCPLAKADRRFKRKTLNFLMMVS